MNIKMYDIYKDVSVNCGIGEIPIEGTYHKICYFKVHGTYKDGSSGRCDAEHIVGMIAYARSRYYRQKFLLDLSELSYEWGDEMDCVLGLDYKNGIEKFAIIVGPKCKAAISTLICAAGSPPDCLTNEGYFDNFQEAYNYLIK